MKNELMQNSLMSHSGASSKRNELLDIIRGLLIILVVLGHTNTILTRWIYSFHMAAFFAISGFLWNEKVLESKDSVVRFLKKRIQRLYLPFVFVNCLFIILNNLFFKIKLYTASPSFASITENWPVEQLGSLYSTKQIVLNCAKSLFLISGHAPIVGVTWFLATLFLISILQLAFWFMLDKLRINKRMLTELFIIIACLIVSYFKEPLFGKLKGGWIVQRLFPAYAAFLMGY